MASQYDNYLSQLRRLKQQRPEMDMYKRNMSAMAKPFGALQQDMAAMQNRSGASSAAQIASLEAGRNEWNQAQNKAYTQALEVESGRQERLDMSIAEGQLKKDTIEKQEEEAKKEAKKNKLSGALRTALQVAGMGVGAALAPATGGASAMFASAMLGGSIGQAAGGFVGIDNGGQLTVKPEDWDMDAIGQGLSSAATQLAFNANQRSTKDKLSLVSNKSSAINTAISKMSIQQADTFRFQLQNILTNGSLDDLKAFLSGMGGI
jgi:hypothetical protein